ncbi:MAG: SMP-30/gluconolactonase/LRE family protein [Proteobacteria bacterium]|nr:SMP-30/gluconolactonase/LRE family protein [Pseudomonadota bacterium]
MTADFISRGRSLLLLTALLVLYLLFWPVAIDPVAWNAPRNEGLTGSFAPNDVLASARIIDLGAHEGPEDIAGGPDSLIYASTANGDIIRFQADGQGLETFVNVGGRPLGLEFDQAGNLLVANSMLGLQRVSPAGEIELLFDRTDNHPFVYPNDVAVATNGKIYVTQSTSKFTPQNSGSLYDASLLDILEHGGHGDVFEYNPATGLAKSIMQGINYANGIAISNDQQYLLIVELASYRVWRYWLQGANAGSREIIMENIPGFPDNINNGLDGRFWIGLVAPRNELIDVLADSPLGRKVIQRLPAFIRPAAVPSSHVISISGNGEILMNLQDTAAHFPAITGVYETRENLYLSTLFGHKLAIFDKANLADQ